MDRTEHQQAGMGELSIQSFDGVVPSLHPSVFIADGVRLIGDVTIGEDSSVWFNAVLRGDVGPIVIGRGTNVQDLVMCHMTNGGPPLIVGDYCTIGHGAILHGVTIGRGVLIGMGAVLLDGAIVGDESIVAAGSVVTEGMIVPEGVLVAGVPARVRRELTDADREKGSAGAAHYRAYIAQYRSEEIHKS